MMKKILFAISSAVIISACGGGGDTATAEKPKQDSVKSEVCAYSYDSSATTIGFGAFKFTEKKEVKGGFLKFTIDSTTSEAANLFDVFSKAKFKICIEGLDTKDPGRDNNIKTSFFANMESTSEITGRVIQVVYEDDRSVSLIVALKLNNIDYILFMKTFSQYAQGNGTDVDYKVAQGVLTDYLEFIEDPSSGNIDITNVVSAGFQVGNLKSSGQQVFDQLSHHL